MGKAKTMIPVIVIIAIVAGCYFYLSNREQTIEEETVVATAVQEVLMRNLETNYPPTPKELIKYYSEISKCLYNETYTDNELEQMADKLLAIYDDELLENNPREQYITNLKSDVKQFLDKKYKISSFSPSASTDVETYTQAGRECAKLYCNYTIRSGSEFSTTQEVFILRKDTDSGHWKILGFEVVVPE